MSPGLQEEMARLAVRDGYIEQRMGQLRKRIDSGDSPEPIREELKRCLNESLAIRERLGEYYRHLDRVKVKMKVRERKEVEARAMENSKRNLPEAESADSAKKENAEVG